MKSGSVTNEITVVRTFARNRNSTITTKIPPSNKDFCTFPIELSIKRLCRKMSVLTFTSGGRFFCKSSKDASNLSVNSSVLVAGCLVTVNNTAALPRSDAVPSLGNFAPMCTSAMSSNRIGALPEAVPPRHHGTCQLIYPIGRKYSTYNVFIAIFI